MVTITILDDSNYIAPTDADLKQLKAMVFGKHHDIEAAAARIVDFDQQFRRAFAAVGHMYRLPAPSKKHYFSFYVDAANDWLVRHGRPGVAGPPILCAVFGHADIFWTAPTDARGARSRLRHLLRSALHQRLARATKWDASVDAADPTRERPPPPERASAKAARASRKCRRPDGADRRPFTVEMIIRSDEMFRAFGRARIPGRAGLTCAPLCTGAGEAETPPRRQISDRVRIAAAMGSTGSAGRSPASRA